MTAQHIKIFVLAVGGVLGAICIGAVIYIYVRNQKIEQGGSLILFSGLILLGLSVWQSFEFTAGQITLKATSALETVKIAESIAKRNPAIYQDITGNCEEDRKRLLAALQMGAYDWGQVNELLSNLSKSLHDMSMTPIRNLR